MLAHRSFGSGARSAVLLHGFLGSGRNLWALARRLAELDSDLSIVVIDLPGHGSSPKLDPADHLSTIAESVAALTAEIALAPPQAWIGHSFGGRVAMAAAGIEAVQPILHTVIALDVAPGPVRIHDVGLDRLARALLDAPEEAPTRGVIREAIASHGVPEPVVDWLMLNVEGRQGRYYWRIDREALVALNERTTDTDLWPIVESKTVRTEVVRGAASNFVTDEDAARFDRAGIAVHTVPDAGHFLHVEQTEAVAQLIRALLAASSSESGV